MLRDETAERLANALEELLAEYQLTAAEIMKVFAGAPLSSKEKKVVRIGLKAGMKESFKEYPEPSKEKLAESLALIKALKDSPHMARKLLIGTGKQLPHAPGGPLRKIKPEEEGTVCAEIMALRPHCDTREAIQRVASKRGVSERTIYRIWGKYYPKKKKVQTLPKP